MLAVPLLLLTALAACSPADESDTSATPTASCANDELAVVTPGKLTIATDDPAYEPWFVDNDPSNGKGFESAVAYAVADQLGFSQDQVTWVTVPFNKSYAPGAKDFDFDINQISITTERKNAVDFSLPYYTAAQAIIVKEDSPLATATSVTAFKDAQLGAQIGTTSLKAATSISTKVPRVYDDTTKAGKALENGQVVGIVADLPTAFYLTAAKLEGTTIAGQFAYDSGEPEQFGLLLEKGSKLTPCVNKAIAVLTKNDTLSQLETMWLSESADVTVLEQ